MSSTTNANGKKYTGGPNKSLRHVLNVQDLPTTTPDTSHWNTVKAVGHRGCLFQELENTRQGFQKCAAMGCPAVELDVFVIRCGTLVVFHGGDTKASAGDLSDYCGVEGNILDYTYEEAKQLHFNPNFAEFPCPASVIEAGQIPTLEQVLLDAKKSGLHLKIELKGPNTVEPTIELVERLDMLQQSSFSSFDLQQLKQLRQLRPNRELYQIGATMHHFDNTREEQDKVLQMALDCGATEIHLRYDNCPRDYIERIHAAGLGTMAWSRGPQGMEQDVTENYWDVGNDDESMYTALLQTGAQQLCINRPDVLLGLLAKHSQ